MVPYQEAFLVGGTTTLAAQGFERTMTQHPAQASAGSIDLFWLPLGAGGHSVRWNGRVFEAIAARREHRSSLDIYHSALEVRHDDLRYVIEMAPVWQNASAPGRGVVREGPVGATWLGHSRLFRYEVRCWLDGAIPDLALAVDSPRRMSSDAARAGELLALLPCVPGFTWGRDETGCGDMWNSNSLVAWLLSSTGHDMTAIRPPTGGVAPGWRSGLALAADPDVGRVHSRPGVAEARGAPPG